MRTAVRVLLIVIAAILALVLAAVLTITNTDWGRERVRRIALSALDKSVHGKVHLGRISGDLLRGLTFTDLTITDSAGDPFLSVARARAHYDIRTFLSKRLIFGSLTLEQPVIVLNKPPGGTWNFERIFPTSAKKSTTPGFGSWITINDLRLINGRLTVRTPWVPSDTLAPTVRDSLVRVALSGGSRADIVAIEHGFQSVMDFRSIDASLPHVRLADPDTTVRLFQFASLSMDAFPFLPPAAEIRGLRGDIRMTSDSVWFHDVSAALPGTRMRATGAYMLQSGNLNLTAAAEQIALADLRWLYPRLPSSGGGSLGQLEMRYRHQGTSDYVARDARLTVGQGSLSGNIGLAMGATMRDLRMHDTDLHFAGIDTRLVEQMVPNLKIPRRGTLDGHATLAGTMSAMRVEADIAFDDERDGTSRLAAVGSVGMSNGFRATDLRLRVEPLRLELARAVRPTFPIDGTIVGTATVDGSTQTRIAATGRFVHTARGAVSRIDARGTYENRGGGPRRWVDAAVTIEPLALATVGRFVPALKLHGSAAGQLRATGSTDSLRIFSDLHLPDGGALELRGWADVASAQKRYDLAANMHVFNLRSVTSIGPPTSITAQASVKGSGVSTKTMRAALAADVTKSSVDSVPFEALHARVAVANGVATVDSVSLAAPILRATLAGTFGLAPGARGALTYSVAIDSLNVLRRLIPGLDTGAVQPRPGRVAEALARARADSARIAAATEVERAATGAPPPVLHVDSVRALRRDSIGGALYTVGRVEGGLSGFDVHGRLALRSLVARGSSVRKGKLEYALIGGRTPSSAIVAAASLDSIQAAGFALDSAELRATYQKPAGHVEFAIYQDSGVSYNAKADYALRLGGRELRIPTLALRFDTTRWVAPHPAAIRWGPNGIEVQTVELRSGQSGRIYANGRIPEHGAADLELQVSGLELANVVALMQGNIAGTGALALTARLTGTRASPQLRGAASLANVSFRGSPLPDLRASFQYANTELSANAELLHAREQPLAKLSAHLPVNLALTGTTGSRLLDKPMRVDLHADSLPLDALPRFTESVADVQGRIIGAVAARGTPRSPSLAGKLALDFASFRVVPMGVTLRDIGGAIRMMGDSISIDSLAGYSGSGTMSLAGGIGIKNARKPTFALRIKGRNALAMNTKDARLHANADIAVDGSLDRTEITGRATILDGAIYIPPTAGQKVISIDDPVMLRIVDTSVTPFRKLIPPPSPLLENLRVDVALRVLHDTWVRSPEANVEIYSVGDLGIRVNRARRVLTVEGVVNTDRGDYTYLGRQFVLSHGAVTFSGEPEINPLLQINAIRSVELAGRGTLKIQILVAGTMQSPEITLTSDAQPPISQSDLLSYLAFGQSSSSLLQFGGSSGLSGQNTGSGQLVGQAAGLATRQLAAVALDVAAKEAQANAARALGTDVLNITPADIPTDFSLTSVETLLAGTQVEAGKYLSRRTFVVAQVRPTLVAPGLSVEHRMADGYRIEVSLEPRFLLRQPTLSVNLNPKPTSVVGAFLVREWRF